VEVLKHGHGTKTSKRADVVMAAPLVSVVVRAFKPNEWIFEAVDSVIK